MKRSKTLKAIAWTILVLVCATKLFYCGLERMVSGETTIEQEWDTDGYEILFVKDQGWAGSPAYRYELRKEYFIPLFSRKVETINDNDTINITECILRFPVNNITFDKCSGTIKKNP